MSDKVSNRDETTQAAAAELIAALYKANTEEVQPSEGPPVTVHRDPHLRLRRTLTPSLNTGIKKYNEAQFMIDDSTGKRIQIAFSALGHAFQMDAYVWGAEESEATVRMVAIHGISPGVSRTRWHSLGDRISKSNKLNKNVRFVALDWHSIDRTDKPQEEFLTMLPKHIFSAPTGDDLEKYIQLYPPGRQEWARTFLTHVEENCPRSTDQGGEVLRSLIEQGLGWGVDNKPFIPCIKSWSGGVGISMLAKATREGGEFKRNIAGAVIMHPACFLDEKDCQDAVKDVRTIICWAKDDQLVPYELSSRFLIHDQVRLVAYESGSHANFDGTKNLPNFDDEILKWVQEVLYV